MSLLRTDNVINLEYYRGQSGGGSRYNTFKANKAENFVWEFLTISLQCPILLFITRY